jgi:hypothetical protein
MRSTLYAATAIAVVLAATILFAAPHHGPVDVVIDAAQKRRAAVEFPHAAHHEWVASCDTCHHTDEGLTADAAIEAEVQGCVSCHLDPEQADTPSMREMSLKKNPYHVLCVDCHKEQQKGPAECDDCHPKA